PVEGTIPDSWAKALQWRCIGPANMGGRIVAMSVFENDPCCYWIATASGGLLKTSNNGVTFDHQFDHEGSVSIGDVCVAPSNKEILYVGALGRLYGPSEERGVYKTTDGGQNWKKILHVDDKTGIIDMKMSPADPNTLIVAAWEHKRDEYDGYFENAPVPDQYGPVVTHAPGSALYKTTDGGESFKK